MTLSVRHSESTDIESIRSIYAQKSNVAATLQLPFPPAELWESRLGGLNESFYSLVACDAQRVLGHIGVEAFQRPRRKHVANIGLAVDETARRAGVGSRLVSSALDLCHNWLAVRRVELETYTDNAAAIALFTSLGFVPEGTGKAYAFRNGEYVDVQFMAHVVGD